MRSNSQFRPRTTNRRQLIVLAGLILVIVAVLTGIVLILTSGGGGRGSGDEGSVAEVEDVTTEAPTPSPTPPATTPAPPTETPTPEATPTLEPYQYTVQSGDTLYYILQLFGYRDLSVVPEVVALNNMTDENDLTAGETILIPRQTPTPAPTPTEGPSPTPGPTSTPTVTPGPGTPTVDPNVTPDLSGCSYEPGSRCISPDGAFWLHEVVEGDTCAQLALAYDTTVPDVLQDNMLTEACLINPGDILRIRIKVTLTPTLTPTGGPDSTATPTPTLSPPSLLAPANRAEVARGQSVVLQWAAAQPLPRGASYLVVVRNTATDETFRATTESNIYRLPADLQPASGQSITYEWHVVIVEGSSPDAPVISGQGAPWVLIWGG